MRLKISTIRITLAVMGAIISLAWGPHQTRAASPVVLRSSLSACVQNSPHSERVTLVPPKAASDFVVCIDPGHSKATVGAVGRKAREYVICWQIAIALRDALKARGFHVILTKRDMEDNVSNEERAGIANRSRANLLLRLHCDSGSASGFATYYPARQGIKNGKRGPAPTVMAASRRCAQAFHRGLSRSLVGVLHDRGLLTDAQTNIGSKQGALTGSIFSQVPVLLVEMCVISNHHDEEFILSSSGQERMVNALANGVQAVYATN